ncbi:MAG: hypothetical protein HKO59_02430 [Phycisphaerales bacterium]|nr:hypothetical protein [Phycisphaerales bacterium]NNM24839.1 hypothetical protein [Phycisphaerales bacterium]
MTSRRPDFVSRRPEAIRLAGLAAGSALLGLTLVGCGGGEPEATVAVAPPPVRQAPPPAPPKPAVIPVSQLMTDLSIDERIVLPEDKAPRTTEERVAVLEFFDAFARGDTQTLGTMMSALDRMELEALRESGAWTPTIDGIAEVMVEAGPGPFDEKCVLALFEVDGEFQPQLWYYTQADADGFSFEAAPTPPGVIDKLYGDDWIARWHELLAEEMALANALDAEFERTQVNLSQREGGSGPGGAAPAPGSPSRPGFGPGGGGGRRPIGKKRKPPGAMPGG